MLRCDKIVRVDVIEDNGDTTIELDYTLEGYEESPNVGAMSVAIQDHLKKFIYLGEAAEEKGLSFREFSVQELRDNLAELTVNQMMVDAGQLTYKEFEHWSLPCKRNASPGPT